jgi:acetoin utilization deacetylase AcuC-like enzyme
MKLFKPKKTSEKNLLLVHRSQYIERIKQLNQTSGMLSFDTSLPIGIYDIILIKYL